MGYIEGKNVILLIDKGAGYVPALCATSVSINTQTETVEIMTVGDGAWRKPKQQKLAYSISLEGITEFPLDSSDTYDTFNFIDSQIGFTNIAYRMYFESTTASSLGTNVIKMITGEALVTDSNLAAGSDNLMDTSLTLEGFGAYELFDTTTACAATLSTVTYSAQSPLFVDIAYTGLSGATTIAYSVDGSTRRTLAGMSASDTITITSGIGMAPGLHSIEVWPICDNAEDGTSLTTTYTKT